MLFWSGIGLLLKKKRTRNRTSVVKIEIARFIRKV